MKESALEYRPSDVSWATARFLDRPPSLASRVFLYAVIAAVIAAVIYASSSKVAVSVEAKGKIETRAPSVPVSAPIQFTAAKLHVKDGQRVAAGELLIEGDGRLSDQDLALITEHHRLLSEIIRRQKSGRCPSCLRELEEFAPSAFLVQTSGRSQELLAEVRQNLFDFISQESSFSKRAVATSAERRQIESAEQKLAEIRRLGAETRLATQVDTLTSEVLAARSALAERRQSLELQVAQSRNRLEIQLAGLLDALVRQRTQETITAPATGIVSELIVTGEGQLVSPGTPLMKIVRLESGLIATLYVPNQDIAEVEPGMAVRLKLDALPEREFGAATGKVDAIPADVVKTDNPDVSVYEVPVVLDQTSLSNGKEDYPFRLGMTLTGLVVVRYESLLTRGLRSIFHFKDEIFAE